MIILEGGEGEGRGGNNVVGGCWVKALEKTL
jgi:hypothetical protein